MSSFQGILNSLPKPKFSTIRLEQGNGRGSTNTCVCRYNNIISYTGEDFVYTDDPVFGASFKIVNSGVYFMLVSEGGSGSVWHGFSVNTIPSDLSTGINSIASANRLALGINAANLWGQSVGTHYLNAGDVVYPHAEASGTTQNNNLTHVYFARIA